MNNLLSRIRDQFTKNPTPQIKMAINCFLNQGPNKAATATLIKMKINFLILENFSEYYLIQGWVYPLSKLHLLIRGSNVVAKKTTKLILNLCTSRILDPTHEPSSLSHIRGVVANYFASQARDPGIDSHQHQNDSRHI